jgi:hypothetical protein
MAQAEFHRHVGAADILPNVEAARYAPLNCVGQSPEGNGQLFAVTHRQGT